MEMIELLGKIAPGLVSSYLVKRARLEASQRLYQAASSSQYRRPINNQTSGDGVLQLAGTKMREIARHLDENHDLSISVLDDLVNGSIGTGVSITPMVQNASGELDTELNSAIAEAWKKWCERPEVTGELDFSQVERLVARSFFRDGEVFIQHMSKPAGYAFPTKTRYALELLEADMVPMEYQDNTQNILQGIQCNDWNAPVVYYFWKVHPGDPTRVTVPKLEDLKPVKREDIIHLKFSRRIRQRRGVTILHGVINRLRDLQDYEESERVAAKVAAEFTFFIKKNSDAGPSGAVQGTNLTRNLQMAPGMGIELMPGEDIGTIASNRPNTALVDYRAAMLRAVAGGTGARFSSVARDYNGTYSSQRQELVEGVVRYAALFNYFVSTFHRPVYQRWLIASLLAGAIGTKKLSVAATSDVENLLRAEYRPPSMPWIDPLKEAKADETLVTAGLESRSEVMRRRGRDPDKVWAEIQEEKDSGLFDAAVPQAAAAPDPAQSDAANDGEEGDQDAAAA